MRTCYFVPGIYGLILYVSYFPSFRSSYVTVALKTQIYVFIVLEIKFSVEQTISFIQFIAVWNAGGPVEKLQHYYYLKNVLLQTTDVRSESGVSSTTSLTH